MPAFEKLVVDRVPAKLCLSVTQWLSPVGEDGFATTGTKHKPDSGECRIGQFSENQCLSSRYDSGFVALQSNDPGVEFSIRV